MVQTLPLVGPPILDPTQIKLLSLLFQLRLGQQALLHIRRLIKHLRIQFEKFLFDIDAVL